MAARWKSLATRTKLIIVGVVLVAGAVAAAGGDPPEDDRDADEPTTTQPELPDFTVTEVEEGEQGQLQVLTDELDPGQLRAIFDNLRADHTDGDSWWAIFQCAADPEGPWTASGRWANTDKGLFQTNLDSTDDVEFTMHDVDVCQPPPASPTTITPPEGLVRAVDVIAALRAGGIHLPNERDNSANGSADLPFTVLITTDTISVREWATAEAAEHWAELGGEKVLVGPVTTVDFHSGGSTPEYDRDAAEAIVLGLAGG